MTLKTSEAYLIIELAGLLILAQTIKSDLKNQYIT